MSGICLTDILRHKQPQEARERIQNEKKDDEDITGNLKAPKKILLACAGGMELIGKKERK